MPKILVVDDMADNVKLLAADLSDLGHDVLEAYTGAEALEIAKKERPDCILLDVMMPEMDGLETCRRLKADLELASIPVIMVSAKDGNDDIIRGLNVGANDYITKPVDREIVAARLAAALRTKTAYDQLIGSTQELDDLYQALEKSYEQLKQTDGSDPTLLKRTLQGCVKTFIGIVHQTDPVLVNRTNRVKDLVRALVRQIKPNQTWDIELAAVLAYVGSLGIRADILKKHHLGRPLSPEELPEFLKHPQIGHDLIGNIPQLEQVAKVVLYQEKSYNGDGLPFDDVAGDEIPLGARILKVASDYDLWLTRGISPEGAVARLRTSSRYDPRIVEALEYVAGLRRIQRTKQKQVNKTKPTQRIPISELVPGMVLANDLTTTDGLLLILPQGGLITETLIGRLRDLVEKQEVAKTVEVNQTAEKLGVPQNS